MQPGAAHEVNAELGDVSDEQLLELVSARSRRLNVAQAELWAAMAEVARRDPMPWAVPRLSTEQVFDSAADEIRAELLLTRRGALRELERAVTVCAQPRILDALQAGELDRARALVLAEGCWHLSPEQAEVLLDELLPHARTCTATGLAERVRRVAVALDPAWAQRRYTQAVHERRVIGYLNEDGSATVSGQYLPADTAAAACERVDTLAAAAKRAGAHAPINHLRAEVFLALLDGRYQQLSGEQIITALRTQFPAEMSTQTPRTPRPTPTTRRTPTPRPCRQTPPLTASPRPPSPRRQRPTLACRWAARVGWRSRSGSPRCSGWTSSPVRSPAGASSPRPWPAPSPPANTARSGASRSSMTRAGCSLTA